LVATGALLVARLPKTTNEGAAQKNGSDKIKGFPKGLIRNISAKTTPHSLKNSVL
jgi:hypothetical protein